MSDSTIPTFTGTIDQQFFLAPLGGPQHPQLYLDRFPETVYSKSLDSHLVKFMYALLGPAGIGWLRKNYLEARLKLEDYGIETFDLDSFYGNPLGFPRILEEVYDTDPGGLIPRDQWEIIRAKDAKYRNRAIDFIQGARAGNTPFGMRLVARSGLGHEVEIIENYRNIYDQLSDDILGIPNQGFTSSTEEMIVLPRRELPQSEVQTLTANGTISGGTFRLYFPMGPESNHTTGDIAYNVTRGTLQTFLEAIPSIGVGNVSVTGGPFPSEPLSVHFTQKLAFSDVPQLQVSVNNLTGPSIVTLTVTTDRDGTNQTDEIVYLSDLDKHHLMVALDRIKPVQTIVSFGAARGLKDRQPFSASYSGSVYNEVIRYVTGAQQVSWPPVSGLSWIVKGTEKEAPRGLGDLKHHYQGFHNLSSITSYTESALDDPNYASNVTQLAQYKNELIGQFSQYQNSLYPVLRAPAGTQGQYQFVADKARADYDEPLTVNNAILDNGGVSGLINGIYPTSYQGLPGVPGVRYKEDQFYASVERVEGDDYLEIDLGQAQAVNFIYMEVTRKPYNIQISYDILDLSPQRQWAPIVYEPASAPPVRIDYDAGITNPWITANYHFTNALGGMIYTRYLRIKFARRNDQNSIFQAPDGTLFPYSIEVRNLRIGRNIS